MRWCNRPLTCGTSRAALIGCWWLTNLNTGEVTRSSLNLLDYVSTENMKGLRENSCDWFQSDGGFSFRNRFSSSQTDGKTSDKPEICSTRRLEDWAFTLVLVGYVTACRTLLLRFSHWRKPEAVGGGCAVFVFSSGCFEDVMLHSVQCHVVIWSHLALTSNTY